MSSLPICQSWRQRGESPKLEGPDKTQRRIQKDCEIEPFFNSINNNREDQHQPNTEPSTKTSDNLAPFEIETIENHTVDPANPPLDISDPLILVENKSLDNLNPLSTYPNNMQNMTLIPLASSEALQTTLVQPQLVVGGGSTSNLTPMTIPMVNVHVNNISSTRTSIPVRTIPGSNPRSTSTSYTGIPSGGCTLPNLGFPFGGAHQGKNMQGINFNPFVQPNTYLCSTSG